MMDGTVPSPSLSSSARVEVMIFLFLIDSSASMNQRSVNGMTLLDCVKSAVEHVLKVRARDPTSRGDRYMLLTCEDGPGAIKAGWADGFSTFVQELKTLKAHDLSAVGYGLKRAFDLLNLNRLQRGSDNYGLGRTPWLTEAAIVLLLTDGGELTSREGVADSLTLPMIATAGSDLTVEPFRWDQRLFSSVLRFSGCNTNGKSSSGTTAGTDESVGLMSEVTGGKCYVVHNMRALLQSMEAIVAKAQNAVVVNFETSASPSNPGASLAISSGTVFKYVVLVVRQSSGHWPIPESFLPSPSQACMPPRTAQPYIHFVPLDTDPFIPDNFPFDKYELETGAFTMALSGLRNGACWQCFIPNSKGEDGLGEPFGFLRAGTNGTPFFFYVLPYNYPRLWCLLDDIRTVPHGVWRQDFDAYLGALPPYFINPLRNALKRIGLLNVVPDHLDGGLSFAASDYLKKLKQQSKLEADRLVAAAKMAKEASQPSQLLAPMITTNITDQRSAVVMSDGGSMNFRQVLQGQSGGESSALLERSKEDESTGEYVNAPMEMDYQPPTTASQLLHRNAFDIQRNQLVQQLQRLRAHFFDDKSSSLDDEDGKHTIPISQMGNFHEELMKREVLRDPYSDDDTRRPNFGNPFRPDKVQARVTRAGWPMANVDEADEATQGEVISRRGRRHSIRGLASSRPPGGGGKSSKSSPSPGTPSPSPKDTPTLSPLTRTQSETEPSPPPLKLSSSVVPSDDGTSSINDHALEMPSRTRTQPQIPASLRNGSLGEIKLFFIREIRRRRTDPSSFVGTLDLFRRHPKYPFLFEFVTDQVRRYRKTSLLERLQHSTRPRDRVLV